jgi:hypothetical protein
VLCFFGDNKHLDFLAFTMHQTRSKIHPLGFSLLLDGSLPMRQGRAENMKPVLIVPECL